MINKDLYAATTPSGMRLARGAVPRGSSLDRLASARLRLSQPPAVSDRGRPSPGPCDDRPLRAVPGAPGADAFASRHGRRDRSRSAPRPGPRMDLSVVSIAPETVAYRLMTSVRASHVSDARGPATAQ
jgi:hypothetical protein